MSTTTTGRVFTVRIFDGCICERGQEWPESDLSSIDARNLDDAEEDLLVSIEQRVRENAADYRGCDGDERFADVSYSICDADGNDLRSGEVTVDLPRL